MSIRSFLAAVAGVAALAAALSPTMDARADQSFAWHMAQHLILLFIVPLLLLAARPFELFRSVATKATIARTVGATRWMHGAAHPAAALAAFIVTLWATHFSPLYNYALDHEWAHAGEHVAYLTAGFLFWIPVLAPPPLRPLPYPARLLYLFIALPQGALLSFALGGTRNVLYTHYASVQGTAAALADQGNAAALMWIAGGLIVFVAFLATFGVWAARESGTQVQRDSDRRNVVRDPV